MKTIALVLFCFAAFGAFAQNAVLTDIQGTVEIRRAGEDWQSAKTGDALFVNEQISTGFKSRAVLRLGASTLYIQSLTRLSLAELLDQNKRETTKIQFVSGRIRADVKARAAGSVNFSVISPVATASVRGTVFEFNGHRLDVIEGRVFFAAAAQAENAPAIIVNSGESAIIREGVPVRGEPSPAGGRKDIPAAGGMSTHAEPAAAPPILENNQGKVIIEVQPVQD